MYRLARMIPSPLRRRLEVFLVDLGFPTKRKRGTRGIESLGHRGYVGRTAFYDQVARNQFQFMIDRGLQPSDVLCDVGCGSLRGGQRFIEYLERGHYLGLEGEAELVELGKRHELDPQTLRDKAPEFVISYEFEFSEFTRSPTYAIAVSLFSHLNESDIRLCLGNLAAHVTGSCQFFASYFESERPRPNFRRSHPHLGFYYTRERMHELGREAGWDTTFIGEWGSPSGQVMMRFA